MAAKQQQFTKILISVPGPWASRDAVVQAITASGSGFHFAGRQLVETATHRAFHLDVLNPDVMFANTTGGVGRYRTEPASATGVVVRLTAPGGTVEMARQAVQAAAALVRAGGHRVRVDSSGGEREGAEWLELAGRGDPAALCRALGEVEEAAEGARSWGMGSFGVPDVIGEGRGTAEVVVFLHRVVVEGVKGVKVEAVAERRDEARFNPFGVWRVKR